MYVAADRRVGWTYNVGDDSRHEETLLVFVRAFLGGC